MSLCFFLTLLLPINAIPSDNFLFIPPESARTSVLILSDNPTWKKINTQDQTVCDLYPNWQERQLQLSTPNGSIKQQNEFICCSPNYVTYSNLCSL